MPPIVIAHRTCPRDAAENSVQGVLTAARLGADAVEIDVRLTADGTPVLMHDKTLWRTTRGLRRVRSTRTADVVRRTIRGSAERVPTLDEVLRALPESLVLAMDIKDPAAGPATLAAVRAHRSEGRVLWWSQHDAPLRLATAEAPELDTALLRDTSPGAATLALLDEAAAAGVGGVSAAWESVDEAMLDHAHGLGLKVFSWCQSEDGHVAKRGLPLDGVVTDWPVAARTQLGWPQR